MRITMTPAPSPTIGHRGMPEASFSAAASGLAFSGFSCWLSEAKPESRGSSCVVALSCCLCCCFACNPDVSLSLLVAVATEKAADGDEVAEGELEDEEELVALAELEVASVPGMLSGEAPRPSRTR